MSGHTDASHHLHTRKRIHQKKQVFPHPNPYVRFVDLSVYVLGVVAPLMIAPQVWRVFSGKQVDGLHLATWVTFTLSAIVWLMYGFVHKERAVIIAQALFLIMNSAMVVGILIFS